VARVLAATGRDQCDWTAEYRLFSRSPWQSRALSLPIIQRSLPFAGPQNEPIVLAGDFTHLVKSGKQIPQRHCMRDPLSPPFHVNLIDGLRFFQVTVLCPFRDRQEPLAARSIPLRFEASPVVAKPGKKATAEERTEYKGNLKKRLASVAARQVLLELREDYDQAGARGRSLLVVLDGSFCNQVFFKQALPRTELLCRCRKDAVLCLAQASDPQLKGPQRFYDPKTFSPESVLQDQSIPCKSGWFFHGGRFHQIRYKELGPVFWRKGAGQAVFGKSRADRRLPGRLGEATLPVRGSVMRLVQVKRLDRGSGSSEFAEVSPSCPFGRGLIASGYLYVPLNRHVPPGQNTFTRRSFA